MKTQRLSDVLDRCLMLLAEGATVEECLARYPEHAAELRPLLEMALEVQRLPRPAARPAAIAAGKRQMLDALAEKKRRQSFQAGTGTEPDLLSRARERVAALLGGGQGRPQRLAPVFRAALAGAAMLVLLVVGSLLLYSWLGTTVAQMATLEVTSGLVEVRVADGDPWRPAAPGQQLRAGAWIRTGADSAAGLAFFDGSITALEADTEISIKRLSAQRDGGARVIVLRQQRGRTQHRVEPMRDPASRFEVRSPLAVTAVRGTEFAVAVADDGTTEVAVRTGEVEVKARRKTIQVQAGKATSVRPDRPPETPFVAPTPLPLEDLPLLKQRLIETPSPTGTLSPARTSKPTATPAPTETQTEEPRATTQPTEPTDTPLLLTPTGTRVFRTPTATRVPPTPTRTLEPTSTPTSTPAVPPTPEETDTPTPTAPAPPTPEETDTPTPTAPAPPPPDA